jgi:glycogen(starch) synthase
MEDLHELKSKTVLMTTDTVGGVWCFCMELCKALRTYDIHFHLVTMGAPLLEWMNSPWESIDESSEWLLQLAERLQPDLVHLNCFAYGALRWTAPVLMVAHSDVWSWWQAVRNQVPPKEWNEYFRRVQAGMAGADFLVAPSAAMMHYVREIYSVTVPGQVVYNARSAADFYPGQKKPVVFSMGRIWDEAKNIQLLLGAASGLPCNIRIAGSNSFEGNSFNMESANVSYLGKLSQAEVALELSAASIYVLPAKYEPFGLSVLEAALAGCALVLGDIPSLKEIWLESACYVDTGNGTQLAETINSLLEHEGLRNKYVTASRQRATLFSPPEMARKYAGIYRQLLHQRIYQ